MTAKNMDDIAGIFEKMRFRKKLIGGVDEQDVWKKRDDLQKAYRSAYEAQQVRYEAILEANGIKIGEESSDEDVK